MALQALHSSRTPNTVERTSSSVLRQLVKDYGYMSTILSEGRVHLLLLAVCRKIRECFYLVHGACVLTRRRRGERRASLSHLCRIAVLQLLLLPPVHFCQLLTDARGGEGEDEEDEPDEGTLERRVFYRD